MSAIITFEHPLSERIRNFLRLEHLFSRFDTTVSHPEPWAHHAALGTLFEIMDCASRAELKLDILQELERQRQAIKHQPDGSDSLLAEINRASHDLQEIQQKFGQHIRENEWLMSLKQRIWVAGGTTPVELPSYYYWQKQDAEIRRQDLCRWSQAMMPTYHAVRLLLEILRNNRREAECLAEHGSYQQNSLAKNIHLIIIEVPAKYGVMPEVSANKYFTHVRFLHASQEAMRGSQAESDVEFKLIMCSFDSTWV